MARRNWTDEEKAEALALLADASKTFYEVKDLTGVPVGTLHRWAIEAGLERSDDQTRAASERRRLRLQVKREAVAEEFLDRVSDMMGRMDEPHVVGFSSEGEPRVMAFGASGDCRNYMTAAAIAIDKFRLEMGEHTQATRSESVDVAGVARGKVDELAERRRTKSA